MSRANGHHNGNGNGKGKPGPKPKIGDQERAAVIGVVSAGGSLNDAASIIGVAKDTLYRALRDDADFRTGVDRAAAQGKLLLIEKVGKAREWQAAAWMLERKYGAEYGKRVDVTHAGTVAHDVAPLMQRVLSDPAALAAARLLASRASSTEPVNGHTNGNGHAERN